MSRIKRIHVPIVVTGTATYGGSTSYAKLGIPAFGKLAGIVTRIYPADAAQTGTITVDATGGTFTVTRNAVTSGAIAANATAATVQTALDTAWGTDIVVVTRSGAVNAYVYTLTFSGLRRFPSAAATFTPLGLGTYYALTTSAVSLTGGAATAAVVNTNGTSMTSTADITIVDRLSSVVVYGDSTFAAASTYTVPAMTVVDTAGAAIVAAAGYAINTSVPLCGLLDAYISNATVGDKGSLWLLVEAA